MIWDRIFILTESAGCLLTGRQGWIYNGLQPMGMGDISSKNAAKDVFLHSKSHNQFFCEDDTEILCLFITTSKISSCHAPIPMTSAYSIFFIVTTFFP